MHFEWRKEKHTEWKKSNSLRVTVCPHCNLTKWNIPIVTQELRDNHNLTNYNNNNKKYNMTAIRIHTPTANKRLHSARSFMPKTKAKAKVIKQNKAEKWKANSRSMKKTEYSKYGEIRIDGTHLNTKSKRCEWAEKAKTKQTHQHRIWFGLHIYCHISWMSGAQIHARRYNSEWKNNRKEIVGKVPRHVSKQANKARTENEANQRNE